jgi:hypothetical protein
VFHDAKGSTPASVAVSELIMIASPINAPGFLNTAFANDTKEILSRVSLVSGLTARRITSL